MPKTTTFPFSLDIQKRSCFCTQKGTGQVVVNVTCHWKKYQNWGKVLTEFIVLNILAWTKTSDDVSLKWISKYKQQGGPTNFADGGKIVCWKKTISGSE